MTAGDERRLKRVFPLTLAEIDRSVFSEICILLDLSDVFSRYHSVIVVTLSPETVDGKK